MSVAPPVPLRRFEMQQGNKKPEDNQETLPGQSELSAIWQELLGIQPDTNTVQPGELPPSPLESDPWSELLHAKGIEVIDLQQMHLHMSDQDVEEILQVMQEQPASPSARDDLRPPEDQPGPSSAKK